MDEYIVWFGIIIAPHVIICQVICKVLGGEPYLNQPQIFVTYDNKPVCFRSIVPEGIGNKSHIKNSFFSLAFATKMVYNIYDNRTDGSLQQFFC